MNIKMKFAVSFAALGLAACSSGTGGGGASAPVTAADYDAKMTTLQSTAPTGDMPTSLNATFTGATQQDLRETTGGAVVGEMMADLELTADWTDGQTTNPWSGTADNFRGTLSGEEFALTGELTVAEAEAKGLTSTIGRSANTIALPTGGSTTVATGAASIALAGDFEDEDGTEHEVIMNLGGAFLDEGGQAIIGPAATQGFTDGGVRSGLIGGGDFYLER